MEMIKILKKFIPGASEADLNEAKDIQSKMTGIDMACFIFSSLLDVLKEKFKTDDVVLVIVYHNKELKFIKLINGIPEKTKNGEIYQSYVNTIPKEIITVDFMTGGNIKKLLKSTIQTLANDKKINIEHIENHISYESLKKQGFDCYITGHTDKKLYLKPSSGQEFIKFDYFKEYFTV